MVELAKDLIMIIPAIIICIKTVYSIFIEIIKSKYSLAPGEESIFKIVISIIGYGIVSIEIVYLLIVIFKLFSEGVKYNPIALIEFSPTISELIALLIVVMFISIFISIPVNFVRLLDIFRDKLEKEVINYGKMKKYRNGLYLNGGLLIFLTGFFILPIIITGYKEISKEQLSTIFGISIFNFTMITILCSLYKAYKEIYDDRVYVLEGEGIFITCKIYLTYSDYYLIISNGEEKFISKNKIEIIRKIKIPNEHK